MSAGSDILSAYYQKLIDPSNTAQRETLLVELSQQIQAAADPSAFHFSRDSPLHRALTDHLVAQLCRLEHDAEVAVAVARVLLGLSFDDHNNRFLCETQGIAAALVLCFEATLPSEATVKYNPKLESSALGSLMADPEQGLKGMAEQRRLALQAQESHLSPAELAERDKYTHWQLLRRYVSLFARNVAKRAPPPQQEGDVEPAHPLLESDAFLLAMLAPMGCVYDSGEIVYYALQTLRFLFDGPGERARARCAFLLAQPGALHAVMGAAMTSRVVRKPSGEGLWVHFEASRLVAALVGAVEGARQEVLAKYGCRALANLINGTKAASLHLEGVRAVRLLLGAREDAAQALMQQSSTARHVIMACLTCLACALVQYQALPEGAALTAELAEVVGHAGDILRLLLKTPDLPASEDGPSASIFQHHQGPVVVQAFLERFPESSSQLKPLLE